MRRAIPLLAALSCLAVAGPADASRLYLTAPGATWLGHQHELFVQTSWTPAAKATTVTVVVARGGHTIASRRLGGWLLGHHLFALPLGGAASGSVTVRVSAVSKAGHDARTLRVDLP